MHFQLSVIIASYKRCEQLELCVEDLCVQKTSEPFEVILVLQDYPVGAADRLRRQFGERVHLRITEFPAGLGTSRARNTGLAMAEGEIVAFLDDDDAGAAHTRMLVGARS